MILDNQVLLLLLGTIMEERITPGFRALWIESYYIEYFVVVIKNSECWIWMFDSSSTGDTI